MSLARGWLLALAGVLLGAATAVLDLAYTATACLVFLLTRVPGRHRRPVADALGRCAVRLSDMELRRISRFHGRVLADPLEARRSSRYLVLRSAIGMVGAGVVVLLVLCLVVGGSMVSACILGGGWGLIENSAGRVDGGLLAISALPGVPLVFLTVVGVSGVGSLDRWFVPQLLGREADKLLRARVAELTSTRDEVLDAVDDERRRIERDLHDGLQQRLVTLGMLVGRARRSGRPEQVSDLLAQAHDMSQDAIGDLREVANRVYPIALDKDGLKIALEMLAERAEVRVRLDYRLQERLRPAIETTIYFVASEAVTNATKHARPRQVEIILSAQRFDRVLLVVTDDGDGGADPGGSGLSGLARRAAAIDGSLTVQSPTGGPTTLTLSVPCG